MGAGATDTEQKTTPWGPHGRQLERYYEEAGAMFDRPKQFFPGSRIADRDDLSFSARDRTALLGSQDYRQGAEGFLGQLLGGDFLKQGASNPYLDQLSDAYGSKASEQYKRITAPSTATRFARAGRSGSDASNLAMDQNERNLAEGLTRANADIYKGDFDMRFGQMMQGLQIAPQIHGMELQDIATQRGQGQLEENYMQRILDEQIARFNFSQFEEEDRLDRFGSRVKENPGFGTVSGTTSGGGSGAQTGVAIAGILASLAGTAFGGPLGGLGAGAAVKGLGGALTRGGIGGLGF